MTCVSADGGILLGDEVPALKGWLVPFPVLWPLLVVGGKPFSCRGAVLLLVLLMALKADVLILAICR